MMHITAATVNLIPSIPSHYKITVLAMSVALQNIMTARCHRLVKLGAIPDYPNVTSVVPTILDLRNAGSTSEVFVRAVEESESGEERESEDVDVEKGLGPSEELRSVALEAGALPQARALSRGGR